jgi:ABC-type sugar transport system substrate-binding protein
VSFAFGCPRSDAVRKFHDAGVEVWVTVTDGAGNVNTQTSQVDNFITQKVDLLLISPFEASPLTPAVKRAMEAGIPVIELDRKTVGDPGKDYTAFIGGDNYKIAIRVTGRGAGLMGSPVPIAIGPGVTTIGTGPTVRYVIGRLKVPN